MDLLRRYALALLIGMPAVSAGAQPATRPAFSPPSLQPYVDPSQLDCPWPKHDNYKQPWRAYLETRSGYDFLQGVGVVYNQDKQVELSTRLMAEAGFKTFRIEVGFGEVEWDETRLRQRDYFALLFRQCKALGIRPTILLNAHHGVPGPMTSSDRKLAAPAKQGDRTLRLADVSDLKPGYSGLTKLTDYIACQIIFTEIDASTGTCKLSRPLPQGQPADKPVIVSTLKYRPLYPIGTPEYEESLGGWLRYVSLVMGMLREAGINDYDLEIWNELTFGSNWLNIDAYYDPPIAGPQIDPLQPGGRCWELARRTLDLVRATGPRDVRVIWGFSNITFYHTAIPQLPAGIDGQTYHPYGTGTRQLEFHEPHKDTPSARQGPPPPKIDVRLAEGISSLTFVQTECLIRHINPQGRHVHPKETPRFYHYITEHGVFPPEMDTKDPALAARMKAKSIIRAFSMWLNKGLDVMHWFCAAGNTMDFGLLPDDLAKLPADAKFDDVATPEMKAIRNLTRCFAGAVPIAKPQQLGVEIAELTEPRKNFDGLPGYPPLWERECFAVLPYQVTATKFVIPVYVMTYDVAKDHPGSRYRVTISHLPAGVEQVNYYDPITDQAVPITPSVKDGTLVVELPVVDYPRVLTIFK